MDHEDSSSSLSEPLISSLQAAGVSNSLQQEEASPSNQEGDVIRQNESRSPSASNNNINEGGQDGDGDEPKSSADNIRLALIFVSMVLVGTLQLMKRHEACAA